MFPEEFKTVEESQTALLHSAFSALLLFEGRAEQIAELKLMAHLYRYSVILKQIHPLTFGVYLGHYDKANFAALNAYPFDEETDPSPKWCIVLDELLIFAPITNQTTLAQLHEWRAALDDGRELSEAGKAAFVLSGDVSLDQRLNFMQLAGLSPI